MPSIYEFDGDATTYVGLVGIISTLVILITVYRSYFNSPYNK